MGVRVRSNAERPVGHDGVRMNLKDLILPGLALVAVALLGKKSTSPLQDESTAPVQDDSALQPGGSYVETYTLPVLTEADVGAILTDPSITNLKVSPSGSLMATYTGTGFDPVMAHINDVYYANLLNITGDPYAFIMAPDTVAAAIRTAYATAQTDVRRAELRQLALFELKSWPAYSEQDSQAVRASYVNQMLGIEPGDYPFLPASAFAGGDV